MEGDMSFTSPFSSTQQIHDLVARYLAEDAKQEVKDADVLVAGANLLRNIDIRSNLRAIYRWKLQSFVKRFARYRDHSAESDSF
jgi:hypothetical protein